ncbi:N-acetylneuraminate epimerase [compost metagenome]
MQTSQLAAAQVGAASAVLNGKLYVISGFTSAPEGPKPLLGVAVYDPLSKTVRAAAPIPTPRFGAMSWVEDGKIHVAGGVTPLGKPLNHLEAYDPVRDRWEILTPLQTPRAHAAVARLHGKTLVAGGHDGMIYHGFIAPLGVVEAMTP